MTNRNQPCKAEIARALRHAICLAIAAGKTRYVVLYHGAPMVTSALMGSDRVLYVVRPKRATPASSDHFEEAA